VRVSDYIGRTFRNVHVADCAGQRTRLSPGQHRIWLFSASLCLYCEQARMSDVSLPPHKDVRGDKFGHSRGGKNVQNPRSADIIFVHMSGCRRF